MLVQSCRTKLSGGIRYQPFRAVRAVLGHIRRIIVERRLLDIKAYWITADRRDGFAAEVSRTTWVGVIIVMSPYFRATVRQNSCFPDAAGNITHDVPLFW